MLEINAYTKTTPMQNPAYDAALAALERIINDPSFGRLHGRPHESLSPEERNLLARANAQADELARLRASTQRQRLPYYQD